MPWQNTRIWKQQRFEIRPGIGQHFKSVAILLTLKIFLTVMLTVPWVWPLVKMGQNPLLVYSLHLFTSYWVIVSTSCSPSPSILTLATPNVPAISLVSESIATNLRDWPELFVDTFGGSIRSLTLTNPIVPDNSTISSWSEIIAVELRSLTLLATATGIEQVGQQGTVKKRRWCPNHELSSSRSSPFLKTTSSVSSNRIIIQCLFLKSHGHAYAPFPRLVFYISSTEWEFPTYLQKEMKYQKSKVAKKEITYCPDVQKK